MREIKFRAWDVNNKCYEYMEDLYWFEENGVRYSDGEGITSDYIIEQFTGLHDKNGKEIYEGDILVCSDRPTNIAVSFYNGCFYTYDGNNYRLCGWMQDAIEIIGNIHKNPELIQ